MRELDAQIDRKNLIKRSQKSSVEKAIQEGMDIAENLRLEGARLRDEFESFTEFVLKTTLETLGGTTEDLGITYLPFEPSPEGLGTCQLIVSHSGVPVMRVELRQINALEYQFISIPIDDDDETNAGSGQLKTDADTISESNPSLGRGEDVSLAVSPEKDDA